MAKNKQKIKLIDKLKFASLILIWSTIVFITVQFCSGIIFGAIYNWFFADDSNFSRLIFIQIVTLIVDLLIIFGLAVLPIILSKKINKKSVQRIFKQLTLTKKELGFTGWLKWSEIGLAFTGVVLYIIFMLIFLGLAYKYMPWIDFDQKQELGFKLNMFIPLGQRILSFLVLVVFVPIAEEIMFRGYIFGQLNKKLSFGATAIITSLLFALVHGAWNVGVDVFALALSMSLVRYISKSLYPSILMHMLKNGVAFFILINMIR